MATVEEQAGEESGQAQEGDTNGSPLEASVLSTVQTIQAPLISGLEPETHFTSSFLSPCSLSSKSESILWVRGLPRNHFRHSRQE